MTLPTIVSPPVGTRVAVVASTGLVHLALEQPTPGGPVKTACGNTLSTFTVRPGVLALGDYAAVTCKTCPGGSDNAHAARPGPAADRRSSSAEITAGRARGPLSPPDPS
jgi:hypothetical protein